MNVLDLMPLLTVGPPTRPLHQSLINIDIYLPHIVKQEYVV